MRVGKNRWVREDMGRREGRREEKWHVGGGKGGGFVEEGWETRGATVTL